MRELTDVGIRNFQGEKLPEDDPETPHIRCLRVILELDGLGRLKRKRERISSKEWQKKKGRKKSVQTIHANVPAVLILVEWLGFALATPKSVILSLKFSVTSTF